MDRLFKAALFDLDGTLFDTEGQYSVFWQRVGLKYHPDIPDFANVIKGTMLSAIMDRYFPSPSARQQVEAGLHEWEYRMQYRFFPGAETMLQDLRGHGVKVAVVTSSNREKMASVDRQMPNFELLFDHVFTAEDFAYSKPHPDCYLRAADFFGLRPQECVVFEDAFSGLEAGMRAGMFTIGMATSNPRPAIEGRCSWVLDDFKGVNYQWVADLLKGF